MCGLIYCQTISKQNSQKQKLALVKQALQFLAEVHYRCPLGSNSIPSDNQPPKFSDAKMYIHFPWPQVLHLKFSLCRCLGCLSVPSNNT